MIGSLRGVVLERHGTELLVEVGGLGYVVQVTPATAASQSVGAETFLHVHHHRREDAEVLFGFTTIEDRRVFETLIATHGVGPALGLAILSVHDPTALVDAVAGEDVAALCLVPGVGRKTAARLLVELKSRLVIPDIDVTDAAAVRHGDEVPSVRSDVREALVGLGYGSEEISRVLGDLPDGETPEALREALRRLAVA